MKEEIMQFLIPKYWFENFLGGKKLHARIRGQVKGSACSVATRLAFKLLDESHLRQSPTQSSCASGKE